MRSTNGAIAVVVGVLCVLSAHPTHASKPSNPDDDCVVARTQHFEFHDDPWINLHHFLFQWARNIQTPKLKDHRRPIQVEEAADFPGLTSEEQQAWWKAADYYRRKLVERPLLFDRDLIDLRSRLGELACSPGDGGDIDPELWKVLSAAMPVYRKHWWPRHRIRNGLWIQERLDQLKTYETPLADKLAMAYGGAWPQDQVRVDVSVYANWAGAYTTNRPNQVTISSRDYTGIDGLEILFHEVSHATFFEQRLFKQLADAFEPFAQRPPQGLAHTIQFATPIELLRQVLGDLLPADHQFVGEQVAQRGSMRDQYAVVVQYWTPFLEGLVSRDRALRQIAGALAEQEPGTGNPEPGSSD